MYAKTDTMRVDLCDGRLEYRAILDFVRIIKRSGIMMVIKKKSETTVDPIGNLISNPYPVK